MKKYLDFSVNFTDKDHTADALTYADERNCRVCKFGKNYAIDFGKEKGTVLGKDIYPDVTRRYWFIIKEKGGNHTTLFMSDDKEKFDKFVKYSEINEMSERDNLEISTDLEGKLFLTLDQRQRLYTQAAFC
jgi:hypothetical protein